MSAEPSSSLLDRREALRRVALILGGAVSAPAALGVLAGCDARSARVAAAGAAPAGTFTPRVLVGDRAEQVATIAEHIVPRTDTPGARDAAVHEFVDVMLAEYYPPDERARFLAGLAAVDERARRELGRPLLRCEPAERHALLARLDARAFDARAFDGSGGADDAVGFMRPMKELTLLGYYTSQVGASQELRYDAVPGRYDGCAPFGPTDRISAL